MRVIAKPRLKAFWSSRKHDSATAERDLGAWYKLATHADWPNFGALKQTFGSADRVGSCVVFDVGNNRYRLICRVNFKTGVIYVLEPMDHAEYDKMLWVGRCGCHEPPPKKPPAARNVAPKGEPVPRKPQGRK